MLACCVHDLRPIYSIQHDTMNLSPAAESSTPVAIEGMDGGSDDEALETVLLIALVSRRQKKEEVKKEDVGAWHILPSSTERRISHTIARNSFKRHPSTLQLFADVER